MNQIVTSAIVLRRIDYGEADRIVTVLTPDQGKLRLMAKGVRRVKSKLAGGIELFSVSSITFIRGRGEIGTLISSRLDKHYGRIVGSMDRVQLGYEFIKLVDKVTEDEADNSYFDMLRAALEGLDDPELPLGLVELWFNLRLLAISGHAPNLRTDVDGHKLSESAEYQFLAEDMAFREQSGGPYGANAIKLLRLAGGSPSPAALGRVQGAQNHVDDAVRLAVSLRQYALDH